MLGKHWDLIKILPMTTKLLMTCGPIPLFPRSAFMETPIGYQHHTQVSSIYTHMHTKLHISTYYYTCQHKSMPHSPHEGSKEAWHIAHFWVSYDRCATPGLPMGWSEGLSWQ